MYSIKLIPSLQKELSAENLLQTSLSSDCLLPYHNEAPMLHPIGKPQRCSSPQLAKLQQHPMLTDENDENRQPAVASFDVAHSLPSCLNEHVRQQAKTRLPRVRVVRKSANQACAQSTDQQELHSSTASAPDARPALQVSWPLPASQTTVALTDIAAIRTASSAGDTMLSMLVNICTPCAMLFAPICFCLALHFMCVHIRCHWLA